MMAAGRVHTPGRMVAASSAAGTAAIDVLHTARFPNEVILRNTQIQTAGCIDSSTMLQAGIAQFHAAEEVNQ